MRAPRQSHTGGRNWLQMFACCSRTLLTFVRDRGSGHNRKLQKHRRASAVHVLEIIGLITRDLVPRMVPNVHGT